MYSMMDGMIYFNNDCIKLRYDVINRSDAHAYQENEVFDFYYSIFDLQPGERVKQGTPLDSFRDHKLAYIIENKIDKTTSKVKFVPYLHERRVYLNRQKMNTQYFYTTIETCIEEEDAQCEKEDSFTSIVSINLTESKMYVYSQNGVLFNRENFSYLVHEYGEVHSTSSNGHHFIFKKSSN